MVRRRTFIKTSAIAASGLLGVAGNVSAADDEVSSTTPPADYNAAQTNVQPHTSGATTSAPQADARVLIIKDRNAWDAPAHEEILSEMGVSYQVINSDSLANHDLSPYELVIIPGDQFTETYSNLASNESKLRNYAESGTLFASAATGGWAGGDWSPYLPGNIEYMHKLLNDLTVVGDNHAPLADISDSEVDNWGASTHGYFPTVPDNANVGVKVAGGDPTYLTYQLGNGGVLAHAMTLEFAYGQGIQPGIEILRKTIAELLKAQVGGEIPAQNGLAIDGGSNVVHTISDGQILRVDLNTKEIIGGFNAPSGTNKGLAFGNGSLWYADGATDAYNGKVLELDPETGDVLSKITSGYDPYGLAFGDGSLWVAEVTAVPNAVHEFSPDGTEQGSFSIDGPGKSTGPNGLAFYKGSIFVGTKNGLYQYDLQGNLETTVNERETPYNALAGSDSALYGPDQNGYLTVLRGDGGGGGPKPLPGFNNPPTDPDGDGLYEDLNGDGTFDITDVQAFFEHYNSPEVQNNAQYYDFNGDGSVDVIDVQALFNKVS